MINSISFDECVKLLYGQTWSGFICDYVSEELDEYDIEKKKFDMEEKCEQYCIDNNLCMYD